MIDLSKISKVAMDVGLTVTSHLTDVTFNYIPEIEFDEFVELFVLQRFVEGSGYDAGICAALVKRENGELYLIGNLESKRYDDAWRFLNEVDYEHFVNAILPAYNIGISDSYVRNPVMATSENSATESSEFFYYTKIEFPNIDDENIEDNILLTSLGDMIYNIATYRSLMDAHYDVGLNKWHADIDLVASINGGRCNVRKITNGVMLIEHMGFGVSFAYHNNRMYVAISNLNISDNIRHLITDTESKANAYYLRVFSDHFRKVGLDINLFILNEKDRGPLKVISETLSKHINGTVPDQYDILAIEITPLSDRIGVAQIMSHYLNVAMADSFQSINVAVKRAFVNDEVVNAKPLNKVNIQKDATPKGIEQSDFFMSSVKVS